MAVATFTDASEEGLLPAAGIRILGEILLFGAAISAIVCIFMSMLTEYSFKKELKLLKKLPYILLYILVLIIEISKQCNEES